MLHINKIRENKDSYIALLKVKNMDASDLLDSVIVLDDHRKLNQKKLDEILSRANQLANQIGVLYKQGKVKEANTLKEESLFFKEESKGLQKKQIDLELLFVAINYFPSE